VGGCRMPGFVDRGRARVGIVVVTLIAEPDSITVIESTRSSHVKNARPV